MIINKAALNRQSTVMVLLVFIIIAGISSYASLPRESDPDITIPYIFVQTNFEGVAPEDMETLITMPIERKLKGLSGTKEISSISDDGVSIIKVEFNPDVDIDDALQKVRDKVDQAKPDLPSDLPDEPVINEVNLSEQPILNVVLSGPFSLKRLKVFAEQLEDRIESVQGVLDAKIIGGLEREIHVEFDMDRVAFYNIPLSSLLSSVKNANVNTPGGSVEIGKSKYLVRVPEDFKHPDEIDKIVVYEQDGRPIYLRDIATIRDHYKDPTSKSRFNGIQSVTIEVKKRAGENIIRIIDTVKEILKEEQQILPPTLKINLTADQSDEIRQMVADLQNNIITGLLLVLIVVFAFIGGRSALFVSLAIPLSMLITFTVLEIFSYTLNMVILFSLILSLGMLVDNGIVVVENIYRHMGMGKSRLQAAMDATDEVAWPVIASTLTTVGAFFPMVFWPGIMGEFMSYLPITVIIALTASLFVALVINPVLSAKFQDVPKLDEDAKPGLIDRMMETLKNIYRPILEWSLDHRLWVVLFAFAFLIVSTVSFGMFGRGVEFLPKTEPKRSDVKIKAPVGTNLEASDQFVKVVEKIAAEYPDIEYIIANTGESGQSDEIGTHYSLVKLDYVDIQDRSRPSSEITDEIRGRLQHAIRGAEVRAEAEKMGPPTGSAINMEIYGKDLRQLGEITASFKRVIKDIPGLVDLKDNYISAKPEIRVDVDKEKAAIMGLDAFTIAQAVKTAINGVKVGVYREGKDEYDIVARLPKDERDSLEDIRRIIVSGPKGEPIPITSLADVTMGGGLGGINRIDQKRVVTISADVSGRLAEEVIADINKAVSGIELPRGYSYKFTGEQEEQAKASAFLERAFAGALFLIFIVLVTQFNSVATPFIILTAVILSLGGVMVGLLITGTAFGVIMTGVGVLSLAGVVVNNAIVLIDYFEQLKEQGRNAREALIEAGLTRFRPVLLTAITTVLGLIPMATGVSFDFINMRLDMGSETSQWWGPMAVAVIFGLAIATVLTLVVVPTLCSLQESWQERTAQRKSAKLAKQAVN
ncbi:efflux RND transporter permease subunit [Maridesulfovibrio salexigens]|uniref:Acriflavin resistance protein n=1 Tax=Maridesulfovibrio salexigens (strain ATCC 14822 / DSM 2638 / NCIMB 8403 / VKM B-1763) TaxID=526222 RepID=C6BZV6_MARSD|nr:efflux RND transporter permease subunit [Maridesulfovibrio salexigens]ACS79013.1 acriflavin resistance protein [Maridesulfovibrio salexigens DSM 2638]